MAKTGSVVITQGTQEIANNRTYITVTGKITTTGESWRGDSRTGTYTIKQGNTVIKNGTFTHGAPANSTTTLFTVSLWITHDSSGDSGKITASYNYDSGWCSASAEKTLTDIPRQATITSAPDFNDTQNPTIKYSNPTGSAVASLQACIANTSGNVIYVPYKDISKTGTSYTFTLNDTERNALIAAVTSGYSQKIKFYIKTVISESTFYSTSEKTFSLINAEPTLSPSVIDVNENTIALTGNAEVLVRYLSNAKVDSGGATYKGATIKSQKVICGNKSIETVPGIIEGVGSNAFLFNLTDSRNNPVSDTKYAKGFIEYINLTCNLNANPPDAEGDMTFSVTGNCFSGSFGAVDNSVKVYYRYKANSEEYCKWIEAENVVLNDDNTYVAEVNLSGLNYQNKYTFQAMSVDALIEIESVEKVVKTVPVFDWGENDFNFNVPVNVEGDISIKGNVIFDYIIEQGVSGIWTYEKWASGKAVCWGKYSAGSYSSGTSTWNNLYFSGITMVDFPANLFISAPMLNWSASARNFNGSFYKDSYITATKTGAWGLSKPTAFTDIVVYIDLEAKGRWKE